MAENVNIYVAGAVVAGVRANRRRCAANLMHACSVSKRRRWSLVVQAGEILPKINVFNFTPVKTEDIFPMENPSQYAV